MEVEFVERFRNSLFPGTLSNIRQRFPNVSLVSHSQANCSLSLTPPLPDPMESAFWKQLNSLDLIHLNRDMSKLLMTSEFKNSPFGPAAFYLVGALLPSLFSESKTSTSYAPLPPAELMQPIQQLLHLYGHPVSDAESFTLQDSFVRPPSSCSLSHSYMELMGDTEPENIPIKWGLGDEALFAGSFFADDGGEIDVMEPGKTYPDSPFEGADLD